LSRTSETRIRGKRREDREKKKKRRPHNKSREIAFIAGAPHASHATCTRESSAEGRREDRGLPVYCATSLKGFTWSGWKEGDHTV